MPILDTNPNVDPVTGLAWMQRDDVDAQIGAANVDRLCNDSGDATADPTILNRMMAKAEQKVFSILLLAYEADEVVDLMTQDQFCLSLSADIASEYMSRRKGEFTDKDGRGKYYTPFREAVEYFEKLSKGRRMTSASGPTNAQQGGNVKPPLPTPEAQPFIFAPNTNFRGGRGGF